MKSISVVIPNFNGRILLEENLPSVFAAFETSGVVDFEVIISDDASSDDSVSFLKKCYEGRVTIVENTVNQGFSGNVNRGLRQAKYELVLILNSDVKLTQGYFKPLLAYFDQPDTFGVMGRIMSIDGTVLQDAAKYPAGGYGKIRGTKNYRLEGRSSMFTFFMSGANALVDREKILSLGGFNELFNPYYMEDVDLGIRAWRSGFKVYYDDSAVCLHPNSVTIKKEKPEKVKVIATRNKYMLHYLHLDGIELYWYLLILMFKTVGAFILFKSVEIKAYKMFLSGLDAQRRCKVNFDHRAVHSLKEVVQTIKQDIKGEVTLF